MLLAGCSGGDSGGGAAGPVPTADAWADETVAVGIPVILDGSASEGPAGAPVSYQWTLTSKPSGSTASLRSPNSARATFTPDVAGAYTATLVVQANGVVSPPDTVSITCSTGNIAPRANAGADRSAAPGGAITLDGTASRDPNNTALTYSWRIVTQPSGSAPVLSNATTATPTFRADVPGVYTVALTVSDGSLTSAADQASITVATGNLPPVANAGPDQSVTTGQVVTLSGTRSTDPNGDPLTYSWCLRGRPQGSTATLNGANTAQPTFTPNVAGSYVICLTVNDGQVNSNSDTVVIEARGSGTGGGGFNQGTGFGGLDSDFVSTIVVATDGTRDVFVGGRFSTYNGTPANALIRLHPDGTVAHTFGTGFSGNQTGFETADVRDIALARGTSGQLYAVGEFTTFNGQPVPRIARLNADGSLDTMFRSGLGFNSMPLATLPAQDGSGDLYVGGIFQSYNGVAAIQIARLNADGSLDTGFATGTGFEDAPDSFGDSVTQLLSATGGRIYVGGGMQRYNGQEGGSLVRLNPDGTRDVTFAANVGVNFDAPVVEALAPAADGTDDIYVGGRMRLVRLKASGAVDPTFGSTESRLVLAIAPAQDGTGDVLVSTVNGLIRLSRNGAIVSTFHEANVDGGIYTIVPVLDGTRDFYIGGLIKTYNGVPVNHIARVHADGTLASVVSGGP
jgi:uncharacterized delta-60 repeat protein